MRLALALLLCLWTPARAQKMGIIYQHVEPAPVESRPQAGEVGWDTLTITGGFPAWRGASGAMLIPGITFQQRSPAKDASPSIYTFGGSLIALQKLDARWRLIERLALEHSSDLEGHDERAWRGGGLILALHAFHPDHRIGFGAILNRGQGGWILIPAFQWVWRSARWKINTFIPHQARVGLRLTPDFDLGPAIVLGGGGGVLYDLDLGVEQVNVSAGLSAHYRLAGPIFITLFGGATVFQRFTVRGDAGHEELYGDPTPVARVGVEIIP